jgi:hypothetical protein
MEVKQSELVYMIGEQAIEIKMLKRQVARLAHEIESVRAMNDGLNKRVQQEYGEPS